MVRSLSKVVVGDEEFLPRFPKIDLETIEILDAPADGRQFPKPQPKELDALLLSEAKQMRELGGLTLPEYVLLNDLEPLGPDISEAHDQGLQIHESQWLDLIQRNQWLKFNQNVKGENFMWDPADVRVWNAMRPILELADRMLKMAVHNRWLYSISAKQSLDRVSDVTIIGPYVDELKQGTISRFLPLLNGDPERVNNFLLHMSEFCLFTFDDDESCWAKTYSKYDVDRDISFSILALSTQGMDGLFNPEMPKEEKNQRRMTMAITICHELMHAISARMTEEHRLTLGLTKDEYCPWSNNYEADMFFDNERWAETGRSFTLDFFASDPQEIKSWKGVKLGPVTHIALGEPNPNYLAASCTVYKREYEDWRLVEGASMLNRIIPVLWTEALFREDFWAWIRKSGPEGMQVPLLGRQVQWKARGGWDRTSRTELFSEADIHAPDDIALRLRRVTDNIIKLRRNVHALRHSWYRDALARWYATPYSDFRRRTKVESIPRVFSNHTLQGEFDAHDLIRQLWCDRISITINDCFYHAISNLARATTPVRFKPIVVKAAKSAHWVLRDVWEHTVFMPQAPTYDNFHWKENNTILDEDERSALNQNQTDAVIIHKKNVDGAPSHVQINGMYDAREDFVEWSLRAPLPRGLVTEFNRAWRSMFVSVERTALADVWHDFDFVLPEYQDSLSQAINREEFYDSEEFNIAESPLESPLSDERRPKAKMVRPIQKADWTRYVTVGEVGDHQYVRDGESVPYWGLRRVPGGNEVAVYDISDIVAQLPENMTVMDILAPRKADMQEMGLMIHEELSSPWAEMVNELKPICLVAVSRQREDVFMHDGNDGRPRWVIMGHSVYDMTSALNNITYDLDISNSIQRTTGINPAWVLMGVYKIPGGDILEQMADHKIGYLRDEFEYTGMAHRFFTKRDLAWHVDEECGYYVAIDGDVYDVTEYRHIHPGGEWALERIAGLDITNLWKKAHSTDADAHEWLKCLRVGKLVKEHNEKTHVEDHEISLGKYIFNMLPVLTSDDEDIRKWAAKSQLYWGTSVGDMDAILKSDIPVAKMLFELTAVLFDTKFSLREKVIVSKRETHPDKLPLFNRVTLSRYDGNRKTVSIVPARSRAQESRYEERREGFVAVDGLVYNVWSLCNSNRVTDARKQELTNAMGNDVTNSHPSLAAWLQMEQKHRIVGRYIYDYHQGETVADVTELRPERRRDVKLNDPYNADRWGPINEFRDKPLAAVDRDRIFVAPISETMDTDTDSNPSPPPVKRRKVELVEDPLRSPRLQGIRDHVALSHGNFSEAMDLDPISLGPTGEWTQALSASGLGWNHNPVSFRPYRDAPGYSNIRGKRSGKGTGDWSGVGGGGGGGSAAGIGNPLGGDFTVGNLPGLAGVPSWPGRPPVTQGPTPNTGEKRPRRPSDEPR